MILSSGGEEKRIRDVAVGEVWLAGGQSNMEFAMRFDRGLEKEKQRPGREIRYFEYPRVSYPEQITEADYGRLCADVKEGDTIQVFATPLDGYQVASIKVHYVKSGTVLELTISDAKFIMPNENVKVEVIFSK